MSRQLGTLMYALALSSMHFPTLSQECELVRRRQTGLPEIDAKLDAARKSAEQERALKAEQKRARKSAQKLTHQPKGN